MLKRIIKSILWRTGISQKVPPMIWKSVKAGDTIKLKYVDVRHPVFPVNFDNAEISTSFKEQNATFAEVKDYLIEMEEPVLIEPNQGLAILGNGKFLEQTRYLTYTYPGTFQYWAYKLGLAPVSQLDEAIHIDGYVGANYYNYFADILCAFCWGMEKAGMKMDKPLIIGSSVFNTRQFQWLLNNNAWFKSLPWHVLDGKTFVKVKKLYKPFVFLPTASNYISVRNLYNPPVNDNPQRKIFHYRAPKFGRTVKNMEEIKPVLLKYGFELIDTGEMSIEQQLQLFADTRYMIAVHGAGIINTIFSNYEKLALLEILPGREKLNTHFYWLAETLGYRYDALLTEDMNAAKKFNLDPAVLEKHINKLLAN